MKRLLVFAAALISAVTAVCAAGCSKQVNYYGYVSEKRSDVYLYEDDEVSVKLYCTAKEQPYNADGVCGDVTDLIEIFVSLPRNPQELTVSCGGLGGEMNYQATQNGYYLCFTAPPFDKKSVEVTLTADGESKSYNALTVRNDGVMSCEQALSCVVEHDKELFDSMTANGLFDGEIFIRLLYDEGCYYYVGVCNKQKNIKAYLLDGERGKIIAAKELQS